MKKSGTSAKRTVQSENSSERAGWSQFMEIATGRYWFILSESLGDSQRDELVEEVVRLGFLSLQLVGQSLQVSHRLLQLFTEFSSL